MRTQKLYLLPIIVSMAFLIVALYLNVLNRADASVAVSNEYRATTTDATWSTAVTGCKDTLVNHKTLGSVIVTKTSNAIMNIYYATTTASHSNHPTTTIASFPLTTVGTYTFDVGADRGICVSVDTTVGVASTTITTRVQ